MNKLCGTVLVLAILGATGAMAFGADAPTAESGERAAEEAKAPAGWPSAMAIIGACLGAGICTIGGGYAISRIGSRCMESMARQPEAAGTMFTSLIVSAAMVEGGMLFGILVCLLTVLK